MHEPKKRQKKNIQEISKKKFEKSCELVISKSTDNVETMFHNSNKKPGNNNMLNFLNQAKSNQMHNETLINNPSVEVLSPTELMSQPLNLRTNRDDSKTETEDPQATDPAEMMVLPIQTQ